MLSDQFFDIVNKNIELMVSGYMKERRGNSGSFSELLFNRFSQQSLNIRVGNVIEKSWKEWLNNIDGVELGNYGNIENHQIDLLFFYNGECYYLESKNNINLDTEKTMATYNKVMFIYECLQSMFTDYKIYAKVLCNRYHSFKYMQHFKKPFDENILFGYGDMFAIFGEDISIEKWENFFKDVGMYIVREVTSWNQ